MRTVLDFLRKADLPVIVAHLTFRIVLGVDDPDLGSAVSVQFLSLEEIEIDGEGPRDEEAGQGHGHGDPGVAEIGDGAEDGREDGTAGDGGDEEGSAAFGVATEAAQGEGEDGREDAGFEEQDDGEAGDAAVARDAHGGGDEDDDHGHEDHEHPPRFHDLHRDAGDESTDGKQTLCDGELVGAGGGRRARSDFDDVVDEVAGNGDLCADVAELRRHTPEEGVLFPERLVGVVGSGCDGLFALVGHIGVGDFRDGCEEKDDGEEEHEGGNPKIHPLDGLQRLAAWGSDVFEKDIGCEDGGDDGADGLESLRQVKTHLRIPRGTTGGDERIGRRLQGGETGADDEHGAAEASEATLDARRPEHQGPDAVDAQTGDERPSVTETTDDPTRICERADEVSSVQPISIVLTHCGRSSEKTDPKYAAARPDPCPLETPRTS